MSSRELPPPPLIAPMPWKTGPGRAPSMMTVSRAGLIAAAMSVRLWGLWVRAGVADVLQAVTSATAATAIAVLPDILTVTRSRLRWLADVLRRYAGPGPSSHTEITRSQHGKLRRDHPIAAPVKFLAASSDEPESDQAGGGEQRIRDQVRRGLRQGPAAR